MTDYYRPQQDDCSDCLSVKEALLQEEAVREITIKTCYEMTKDKPFEFTEQLYDRKFTVEEIIETVSGYYTTEEMIMSFIEEITGKKYPQPEDYKKPNEQLNEVFQNMVNDIGGGK